MQYNGIRYEFEHALADTESVVVILPEQGPSSVAVHPAVMAGASVEFTLSSLAKVKAGTAKWLPAAIGTGAFGPGVTDVPDATDILSPVTAIRVTAFMGAVDVEVLQ